MHADCELNINIDNYIKGFTFRHYNCYNLFLLSFLKVIDKQKCELLGIKTTDRCQKLLIMDCLTTDWASQG